MEARPDHKEGDPIRGPLGRMGIKNKLEGIPLPLQGPLKKAATRTINCLAQRALPTDATKRGSTINRTRGAILRSVNALRSS